MGFHGGISGGVGPFRVGYSFRAKRPRSTPARRSAPRPSLTPEQYAEYRAACNRQTFGQSIGGTVLEHPALEDAVDQQEWGKRISNWESWGAATMLLAGVVTLVGFWFFPWDIGSKMVSKSDDDLTPAYWVFGLLAADVVTALLVMGLWFGLWLWFGKRRINAAFRKRGFDVDRLLAEVKETKRPPKTTAAERQEAEAERRQKREDAMFPDLGRRPGD